VLQEIALECRVRQPPIVGPIAGPKVAVMAKVARPMGGPGSSTKTPALLGK
jgi:hypothetical protein